MIPYGRQEITECDIASVTEVLRSDFLTQGPQVENFEVLVSKLTGARFGVAVNSATSALHIACIALGLGSGDVLWTTPITFVASANCGLYCGASVDFVDIDPSSFLMDLDKLETKLHDAAKRGSLPKVIVVVHMAGQSCDMARVHMLSEQFGFHIIEDASHAIGAKYLGESVGSCRYSDITVFSFHPVKIITSGEGGMAMTNDEQLACKMKVLRTHGIERNDQNFENTAEGGWWYEQQGLGYNYRMTDIQAALGLSQLDRLNENVSTRNEISKRYAKLLGDLALTNPQVAPHNYSAWHLYIVRLDIRYDRRAVFDALRNAGIGVQIHYIPVHFHPHYQHLGFKRGDFPESESYYSDALTLPLFPSLKVSDQDYVSQRLHEILAQ